MNRITVLQGTVGPYPTWGKGKSSTQKYLFKRGYVSLPEGKGKNMILFYSLFLEKLAVGMPHKM